ncbi:MAG: RhuM family protein [Minisyncoccia bacterium]
MKKNIKITKNNKENKLVIYQAKSGAIEFRGDFSRETIWATQAQIAEVFGIDRTVATKHINNIFTGKEIDEKSNVQKMHIANSDKPVTYYSLDVILAVGYRTNSARAISFRKWATKILRDHLMKGYTINKKVILKNYDQFLKTVADIQFLLPEYIALDPKKILDLVKEYSTTWSKLDAYDRDMLIKTGTTKKKIKLAGSENYHP